MIASLHRIAGIHLQNSSVALQYDGATPGGPESFPKKLQIPRNM
jgi:hypothetical protein